jgi:hypothetical protein
MRYLLKLSIKELVESNPIPNYFIRMKYSTFFRAFALSFCILHASSTNTRALEPKDPDKAYLLGPTFIINSRNGYDDFSDLQKSVRTPRNDLLMYGAFGAKRFPILKFIRLQVGLGFDMGSVTDDTVSATLIGKTAPSLVGVKHTFYHAAISPELQVSLPVSGPALPFFRIGGGLNFVSGREQMSVLNSDTLVDGMVPQTAYKDRFSFDAMTGFGVDVRLMRRLRFCFSYSFHYWQPVNGSIEEDFPLTALNYHEVFFSHCIQIAMLFDNN